MCVFKGVFKGVLKGIFLKRSSSSLNCMNVVLEFDTCRTNPCKNGGKCFKRERTFYCVCVNDYSGKTCRGR